MFRFLWQPAPKSNRHCALKIARLDDPPAPFGSVVGCGVGSEVGSAVGLAVGSAVGPAVGSIVGAALVSLGNVVVVVDVVGALVIVGSAVGSLVGSAVGSAVGGLARVAEDAASREADLPGPAR